MDPSALNTEDGSNDLTAKVYDFWTFRAKTKRCCSDSSCLFLY